MSTYIKFVSRLLGHLLTLLFILLPLQAVGIVLMGVYLPIHRKRIGTKYLDPNFLPKLPVMLRYFDNADMYIGRDTSVYRSQFGQSLYQHWYWLCLRNPINYFGYCKLGFQYDNFTILSTNNNFKVGDSAGKVPGLYHVEIEKPFNSKIYYEYYYIYKYSSTRCFRFRLGWKIGTDNQIGSWIQWVLVIQPYKSYSGL